MTHYDYHGDPRIASAAEKYDKIFNEKAYDHYILDTNGGEYPPYNVSILAESFGIRLTSTGDEIADCIVFFLASLIKLFETYHTLDEKSGKEIEEAGKGLIVKLFYDYKDRINASNNQTSKQIYYLLRNWRVATEDIIKEAFIQMPFSNDIYGVMRDNINLLKQFLTILPALYEGLLFNQEMNLFSEHSGIVLYNFWGDDYYSKTSGISHAVSLSEEERQMTDINNNILRFMVEYRKLMKTAIIESEDLTSSKSYLAGIRCLLDSLFRNYTKLLRVNEVLSPDLLSEYVRNWMDLTTDIISNETFVEGQIYRLHDYHAGDVVHPAVFRSSKRRQWDAIQELSETGSYYVNMICRDYLEKVETGDYRFPWSSELATVNLNYRLIYNAMNKTYFNNVSFPLFKDCLISADVSPLCERLKNRGNAYGGLRMLISIIGDHCPKWIVAVAPTMLDSNGKPYDKRSLGKSFAFDKPFATTFLKTLEEYGVELPGFSLERLHSILKKR